VWAVTNSGASQTALSGMIVAVLLASIPQPFGHAQESQIALAIILLVFWNVGARRHIELGEYMAVDEQLDQLSTQLSKQSLGPIDAIFNEIASRLSAELSAVISSLRQAANDQPLMTLLLAAQAGYLVARLRRRYARN
jgi:hypothetical protein